MPQSKPFFFDNGSQDTAVVIDWNDGEVQKLSINPVGGVTINFTNPLTVGSIYVLQLISNQEPIVWDALIEWGAAGAPPTSANLGNSDLFNFYWTGAKYLGSYALDYNP